MNEVSMGAEVKVGDSVVFVDPTRHEHNAVVTAVWSKDCINVVFVSTDENKTDSYGRQIERETSVMRHSDTNCFGRSFRPVGSKLPEYRSYPIQK
jgi:hypothetical protein